MLLTLCEVVVIVAGGKEEMTAERRNDAATCGLAERL
jgi:hypothetical protein